MKAGREADRLCDILRDCGCDAKVYMAERCGMEGERFAYNLEEINMPVGYFTLFIVKQHMAEE